MHLIKLICDRFCRIPPVPHHPRKNNPNVTGELISTHGHSEMEKKNTRSGCKPCHWRDVSVVSASHASTKFDYKVTSGPAAAAAGRLCSLACRFGLDASAKATFSPLSNVSINRAAVRNAARLTGNTWKASRLLIDIIRIANDFLFPPCPSEVLQPSLNHETGMGLFIAGGLKSKHGTGTQSSFS